jgi:hypothetical protein
MAESEAQNQVSSPLNANKYVIAVFLFVLSYGVLFAIASANKSIGPMVSELPIVNLFLPLPELNSPMYLLMPIAGFFFIFFLVDWANKFFKKQPGFSVLLPVLLLGLAMAAFYIALFWYFGNYAQLAGRTIGLEEINRLFVTRFKGSGYYIFVLSGLFGWVSRIALEKIKL